MCNKTEEQRCVNFLKWVIKEFTNDEGRIPISGNLELGGMTIFIDHEEYPISKVYELYCNNLKIK